MLVVEPERRLSISQILEHSWMRKDGGGVELEPGGGYVYLEYIISFLKY